MIKSMTGYGRGEAAANQKKIVVEIRSLNSKQCDLSVKMPSRYRQIEYDIRNMAAKRLLRGKIDIYVSYETEVGANTVTINTASFTDYYLQLEDIARKNNMAWNSAEVDASTMAAILRMPEVVQNEMVTVPDEELDALRKATEEALDNMDVFRQQEGTTLMTDLLERIGKIEELKNAVEPYESTRAEIVKTRIRENIEAIGIQVDQNRLEQEMIFYIEKLDITEEKVRLQNHLDYFREVAASEEGAGRKLGFIAQEIGREINTLGSKANEANIQKLVVDMKDELEKIKEQSLNIL